MRCSQGGDLVDNRIAAVSRQPHVRAGTYQGGPAGRQEVRPDGVVMLDDLGGGKMRPIRRRVAVRRHGRRIAARQGAAHGGVDAIVGRAAGDDQPVDRPGAQELLEIGIQEGIAKFLADDRIGRADLQRVEQLPTGQVRVMGIAWRAVMLDEDDRAAGLPAASCRGVAAPNEPCCMSMMSRAWVIRCCLRFRAVDPYSGRAAESIRRGRPVPARGRSSPRCGPAGRGRARNPSAGRARARPSPW